MAGRDNPIRENQIASATPGDPRYTSRPPVRGGPGLAAAVQPPMSRGAMPDPARGGYFTRGQQFGTAADMNAMGAQGGYYPAIETLGTARPADRDPNDPWFQRPEFQQELTDLFEAYHDPNISEDMRGAILQQLAQYGVYPASQLQNMVRPR